MDNTGAPLPGVRVTLSGPEHRSVVTDERGEFSVSALLPGVYEVRSELAGFVIGIDRVTVASTAANR